MGSLIIVLSALLFTSVILGGLLILVTAMPNPNYLAGRRLEYEVKKEFEKRGYHVLRTAGSHGLYDLVAIKPEQILLIQCKVVSTEAESFRLRSQWRSDPPFKEYFHFPAAQILAVKVKWTSKIIYQNV